MNDDRNLKTNVLAELVWEPSVTSDHIGVTAEVGVVTLSGYVSSFWQKANAERAVGRVKGVRAIVEEIEVRLPDNVRHSDDEIAKAALHRLSWDSSIPKDAVKLCVQAGHVTLSGEVAWHYQHDEAAHTIRSLSGVTGVTNHINVQRRPDTSKIQINIGQALHRSWLSHDHVKVTATEGEVHLTGSVNTWQDRNRAIATAWRASGTISVVNEIRISSS